MMLIQLIIEASRHGVYLYEEDGLLKFKLQCDEFPSELKKKIVSHKPELIEFLQQRKVQQTSLLIPNNKNMDITQFPLSSTQQGIWLIEQMDPDNNAYVMSFELSVEGEFCIETAEQAIQHIINRHEPLRTTFKSEVGVPYQSIKEITMRY